jgi:hypothetical protein
MGFSGIEALLLIILGTGQPVDLASFVSPQDYFQGRGIEVTTVKMLEIAGRQPKNAKEEVEQLLALRVLGHSRETVANDKKLNEAVALLEPIAQGKKAQDPFGFARDYAGWALTRLQGKTYVGPGPPRGRPRHEGLAWFPLDVNLVGQLTLGGTDHPADAATNHQKLLSMMGPGPGAENPLHKFIESVGNMRVMRLSFAYGEDPQNQNAGRVYFRFTGKGSHARLVDFFNKENGGKNPPVARLGPRGESITILSMASQSLALVDNTDMVMAINTNFGQKNDLLDQVLALREGKGQSVASGPLKGDLDAVGDKTVGLLVGEVPLSLQRELARGFQAQLPLKFIASMLPAKRDLKVQFKGFFANTQSAQAFSNEINQLKEKGLKALKEFQGAPFLPPQAPEVLKKTLESLQMRPQGTDAVGSIEIAADTFGILMVPRAVRVPPAQKK